MRNPAKIESKEQYDWADSRVEELLPLVNDETPVNDKNRFELKLHLKSPQVEYTLNGGGDGHYPMVRLIESNFFVK